MGRAMRQHVLIATYLTNTFYFIRKKVYRQYMQVVKTSDNTKRIWIQLSLLLAPFLAAQFPSWEAATVSSFFSVLQRFTYNTLMRVRYMCVFMQMCVCMCVYIYIYSPPLSLFHLCSFPLTNIYDDCSVWIDCCFILFSSYIVFHCVGYHTLFNKASVGGF